VTVRELNGHAAHSVTYGPDGDVLSVTVHEPRFTPEERALLLVARRRALAPRNEFGWLISEATDPKNFGRFRVGVPTTDLVAKAVGEAADAWKARNGDDSLKYLRWGAEKV
jgi:hypothetical protein